MTTTSRIQPQLDAWRASADVPIVTAAARVDGSLVWCGVSSAADLDEGGPPSSSLRFPIYSITKTFTAVCVLRLDAAYQLSVDDPVTAWLPDLPLPDTITLAHLLRHTSGLADYGPLAAYHEAVKVHPSTPWTDQRFFDATLPGGLRFAPGTSWSYSNVGYLILRRVIERAAGAGFRQCVHDNVVTPLDLPDTLIAESIADFGACVPGFGREVSAGGELIDVRSVYHPDWCAPGVAVSSVEDVTRFYDALFTGELLDREHLDQMLHLVRVPGSHPPAVTPSCGMGILADPNGPFGFSYGHGGGGPGYSVAASILPRWAGGRLSVAVFCNTSLGAGAQWGEQVLLRALADSD